MQQDDFREHEDLESCIEQTEQRAEVIGRRTNEAIRRTELAQLRTERAERRTLLANERTFSAWLRTGLASIGGGLAVARLLGGDGVANALAQITGVLLVVAGAAIGVLALWRYTRVAAILEREKLPVLPIWVAWLLAGSLIAASVLVLLMIFVSY